uniref:Sbp1 n=1 Tax=Arundo donax TaxID=35708 RepID=A0A0A9DG42_ARUDO
MQQVSCAC